MSPVVTTPLAEFLAQPNIESSPAWELIIDSASQPIWVWQGDDLPIVFLGLDTLPTLGNLTEFTVNAVRAMTRRQ